MEWVVLHTLCAAGMAMLGAIIARGWPSGEGAAGRRAQELRQAQPEEDAFARDLAAMLGYTGEEEQEDEA